MPKPSVTSTKAFNDARGQIRGNRDTVLAAPGERYNAVDAVVEPGGNRHVRFQRTHDGLPVLGGDFVVHSGETGRFVGATVAQQQVIDVPATPKVRRERAVKVAGGRAGSTARLVVDAFDGPPALAWEVSGRGQTVIVDAMTGRIRRDYAEVYAAEAGTGHGLHVGDVPLSTTRKADGTFTLTDPDRGNTVRDAQNHYYLGQPTTFAEFTDADDVWGDGTRADRATAAVDVHYGMARTTDYLRETFGRSGVGKGGAGVTAYVHHSVDSANASWNGYCDCMMFGDGAATGKPFTTIDVVAHEMAHGLNSRTANLVYSGESGGLNEANSDIVGTLVEFWANNPADPPDYLIGEKTETRAPALRRMDEPSRDGKSVSCWTPDAKKLDVHYSSGIGNKFFYTLAAGSGVSQWGDSPPCGDAAPVTGIGNDRAAQIWYRALSAYMVSNTNYSGARDATLLAAADLYGRDSVEWRTVEAAWLAVGVDGSDAAYGVPKMLPFPDSTPSPRLGEPVRIQAAARDPQGQALVFSATNLPPGIVIDPAGLITGAPTVRAEYLSYIVATDPDGNSTKDLILWTIKGPPSVQEAPTAMNLQLGLGPIGNYRVVFSDGKDYRDDPADSFKVTATDLPPGLDLAVSRSAGVHTATIAGLPTIAGSGTTVVTATDADGDQVTASVPWRVLPANSPALPVGVHVNGADGTALVAWQKQPYNTGDVYVTGWIVRVSPGTTTTVPAADRSLRLTGLDTRRAYTIGVRATSTIGNGPEKTITLSPTGLSLAVSPTALGHGKPATLSGRALRGAAPAAGVTLTLAQRPAGRTTWSRVAAVRTDAKGVWRATVKPSVTTAYRVTYAGASGMWPATSATPAVTVRYAVTVKASTTKPKANKKIKISGTAKPARAGVKVALQRKAGSRWVTLTSTKTTAKGAYSFSRAFKRGTWTLRVVVAGGTYNASATSTSVKLKVK